MGNNSLPPVFLAVVDWQVVGNDVFIVAILLDFAEQEFIIINAMTRYGRCAVGGVAELRSHVHVSLGPQTVFPPEFQLGRLCFWLHSTDNNRIKRKYSQYFMLIFLLACPSLDSQYSVLTYFYPHNAPVNLL